MNNRHLNARLTLAALAFASLVFAAVPPASHAQRAPRTQNARAGTQEAAQYSCPMHPKVLSNSPGKCPECNMNLTLRAGAASGAASATDARDAEAARGMKMSIPDIEVFDQNGRRLRFHRDLVKGKTVVINFIFTNCTTICPPLAATFARLQRELGDRAGRDVSLISVSVDPVTDTPERMKTFLTKFKAAEGWTFVSGDKPQMDSLLQALGAYSGRPEDHTPSVIIGNDAKGQWTRAYGLAKPSQLLELINAASTGRLETPATEALQP